MPAISVVTVECHLFVDDAFVDASTPLKQAADEQVLKVIDSMSPVPVLDEVIVPPVVELVHVTVETLLLLEFVAVRTALVPETRDAEMVPVYSLPCPARQAGPSPSVEHTFALAEALLAATPIKAIAARATRPNIFTYFIISPCSPGAGCPRQESFITLDSIEQVKILLFNK